LGAFLRQTMHNCSDRVTERRDAIKNAKNAKSAKSANPWRLALLALLGRAGDLIGAEGGGRTTTTASRGSERSADLAWAGTRRRSLGRLNSGSQRGFAFAVSRLAAFSHLRNLRNLRIPLLGFRLTPAARRRNLPQAGRSAAARQETPYGILCPDQPGAPHHLRPPGRWAGSSSWSVYRTSSPVPFFPAAPAARPSGGNRYCVPR